MRKKLITAIQPSRLNDPRLHFEWEPEKGSKEAEKAKKLKKRDTLADTHRKLKVKPKFDTESFRRKGFTGDVTLKTQYHWIDSQTCHRTSSQYQILVDKKRVLRGDEFESIPAAQRCMKCDKEFQTA